MSKPRHGLPLVSWNPSILQSQSGHTSWKVFSIISTFYSLFVFSYSDLVGIILSLLSFVAASLAKPGVVTPENVDAFERSYPYDGVLYSEVRYCQHCKMIKFAVTRLVFSIFISFSLSDRLVHAIAACVDAVSLGMIITALGLLICILHYLYVVYFFYQDKQLVSFLFIFAF